MSSSDGQSSNMPLAADRLATLFLPRLVERVAPALGQQPVPVCRFGEQVGRSLISLAQRDPRAARRLP